MKTTKQRKAKGEQASTQRNINKSLTGGKKSRRSSGQCHKVSVGKENLPTTRSLSPERGHCHSGDRADPVLSSSNIISDMKQEDQMLHSSAKMKLQLFPLDDRIRHGLEKDGHNPFLELTLRSRKKITSVLEHLGNKWGSSSIATGELMLFPFNVAVDNMTTYKQWCSRDIGISAGDVHAAIGSPENFRLRYGWVSTQPSSSYSSPSLGGPEPVHLERDSNTAVDSTRGIKIQTEENCKDLKPCNSSEGTTKAVEQTVSSTSHGKVQMNQAEVNNEDIKASKISKIENETMTSAEPSKDEGSKTSNDSFTSLLWSDLSNISIGGLLSEASLQGTFNTQDTKLGSGRLASQPTTVVSESLDAFINQLNSHQAPPTLSPDMPSSIFNAEDTCHSFAFSKPSGSGKDFLTLGRSSFAGLSSQGAAPRSSKCPKFEVNKQGSNAVQEPKTDSLPFPGIYNNENSLGLSSIRWNDSLGPFDIPLTPRQIIKDDSVGIGRFVR